METPTPTVSPTPTPPVSAGPLDFPVPTMPDNWQPMADGKHEAMAHTIFVESADRQNVKHDYWIPAPWCD